MPNPKSAIVAFDETLASPVLSLLKPSILLASNQNPSLLRHLDSRFVRCSATRRLLDSEQTTSDALSHFASDSFEMAVVQSAPTAQMESLVRELVRVARQGLITLG